MKWVEVKIFISSTFNDMHAERDYLITEVFPELSEWCEKRRIRLSDVDLRWGVTKEDAESGNTIKACLDCIDECRPFFLCFLGQRRGWVPDLSSGIDESTFDKYKGLKEKIGSYSITEMEIEYATLAPMYYVTEKYDQNDRNKYALIFFRNDPFNKRTLFRKEVLTDEQRKIYTNAGSDDEQLQDQKLQEFKDRISKTQNTYTYNCSWDRNIVTDELADKGEVCKGKLTGFSCGNRPLKDTIIQELKKRIAEEFPDHDEVAISDRFDEDASEQKLYAQTSCFDFVGRDKELKMLSDYVDKKESNRALFIYAKEGTGKSALLSRFLQDLQEKGKAVLFRSCTITDKSSNMKDLYLSLGNEAGLFKASEEEKFNRYHSLDADFFRKLMEKGYDTLILDGLDRLSDLVKRENIPVKDLPEGFSLIISSDDKETADAFRISYVPYELKGFAKDEDKHLLIDQYLLRTLKKLDLNQKTMMISSKGSDSPLYMRIVLNELKNYGAFSTLEDKIASFGGSVLTAFEEALKGIEEEYDDDLRLFRQMIVLIALARDGLSEDELLRALKLMGTSDRNVLERVRILKRRIKPYLNHSNNRDGIHIKTFIETIKSRYSEMVDDCRRALVEVYKGNFVKHGKQIRNEWTEVHGSRELLYQLEMLKDFETIRKCVDDPDIFEHIHPGEYYSSYIMGSFISANMDMLIWDPGKEESRDCYREMAKIFLHKARNNIRIISDKYPHPYSRHCKELRNREDQSEFLYYRDLFYETTQFIKSAVVFEGKGLYAPRNSTELGEFRYELKRFCETQEYSQTESFMNYLSNFGNTETGLSHQIEDLADEADIEKRKIEKYLDSITFINVDGIRMIP